MGDVPEVLQQPALLPSGKRLETVWCIHHKGNHGKLGYPDAFFRPMYEYFRRKLLEREFAMADETPLQVLHEPGRRAQSKSYMWLFRSGEDGGVPIIL